MDTKTPLHRQISSAKVLYIPIVDEENSDETEEIIKKFRRIGIRIDMADTTHWVYSFKGKTWTYHFMGLEPGEYRIAPMIPIERKQQYTRREISNKPLMAMVLAEGMASALADEQARRRKQ